MPPQKLSCTSAVCSPPVDTPCPAIAPPLTLKVSKSWTVPFTRPPPFSPVIQVESVEKVAKGLGWPFHQNWQRNAVRIERIIRGPIATILHSSLEILQGNPFYEQAVRYCYSTYPSEPAPWWRQNFQVENEFQPSG